MTYDDNIERDGLKAGDLVVVTSMAPGTPAVGQIMTGNPRVLA